MHRMLITIAITLLIPVCAVAADTPNPDNPTNVAALSQESINAITTNSATFKKYLESGDVKDLNGLPENIRNDVKDKKNELEAEINANEFLNKYFSVGLFANFDVGAEKRVQNARLVNGRVRIEESNSAQLGLALEAHRLTATKSGKSAWGYFVAIISNNSGAIASGAVGVIYAYAPKTGYVGQQTSINFGVGVSVNPGSQVLGDGLAANQPLPAGETEIRYKKVTLYGVLATVSFGF